MFFKLNVETNQPRGMISYQPKKTSWWYFNPFEQYIRQIGIISDLGKNDPTIWNHHKGCTVKNEFLENNPYMLHQVWISTTKTKKIHPRKLRGFTWKYPLGKGETSTKPYGSK